MLGSTPSRRRVVAGLAAAALVPRVGLAAQTLQPLHVGGVPEESIVAALWARRSGLFRHEGLDVQIDSQRSGSAVAAAVAGGSYGIGKSSLIALISAHARNIPFVLVSPGGNYDAAHPNVGLLVRNDSPLKAAADLNGKTVAVSSLNDLYTISTRAWVDAHGGDSATLRLVELPTDAVGPALATGRVDAAGVGTPQIQEFLDSGTTRILGRIYDAIAPSFTFSAWFTTRDYLAAHRSTVVSFARAMHAASAYVNAHHQQTLDVLASFTGIDPSIIARMPRAAMGLALDPKLVQPAVDLCAKYKVIPAPFDAADFIATGLL